MATITRENIGHLNDKLTVKLAKEDYLPAFEKSLKNYAKNASIPGFRKGMVPSGLIKKMHGQSVFTEEILRTVEKNLNEYLDNERLDIFAQPLPLDIDARQLDMNNPGDYAFAFEIGLKPAIDIKAEQIPVTLYKIEVTEDMINEEMDYLRIRNGNNTELEEINSEDCELDLHFTETGAEENVLENGIDQQVPVQVKFFAQETRAALMGKKKDESISIQLLTAFNDKERETIINRLNIKSDENAAEKFFTVTVEKINYVEKADMGTEFFNAVYPGREIATEEEMRNAVKVEIESYYDKQSRNQLHDQVYHQLTDHVSIDFPEQFLKRWLQNGSEKPKSVEEADAEYPQFSNQLKWTLISTQIINENSIIVNPEELKNFARQQLFGNMGMAVPEDAPWADDYVNRMMKDKKFTEDAYFRIQNEKMFQLLESKANITEEKISLEAFREKLHHHHH